MRFPTAAAILAASSFALAVGTAPASGQKHLRLGGDGPSLQIELTKPFVSADGPFADASFSTSAWDATVAYPLGAGPTLFARMGLLYASIEGQDASLALMTPRLGAAIQSESGNRRAELHVDLPFATNRGATYATGIGIFSNYEEHERFLEETWAVGASGAAQFSPGPGSFLGARVGGTVHGSEEEGRDIYALVSVYGDAPTDRTRFRIEFSSLYLVNGGDIDFTDRSTFFGGLEIMWPFSRFAPALFVRAPIDNTLDATVPVVAGARVTLGG